MVYTQSFCIIILHKSFEKSLKDSRQAKPKSKVSEIADGKVRQEPISTGGGGGGSDRSNKPLTTAQQARELERKKHQDMVKKAATAKQEEEERTSSPPLPITDAPERYTQPKAEEERKS